jgi:uncharacterized protein
VRRCRRNIVTPQEQELLKSLTQKINQTRLEEKDPDAENLLGHELGANPDAVYILAQTVLVQNIALDQARAQITQLQQQLQQAQQVRPQPAHATSFLGRLLGEKDEPVPPPSSPQPLTRGPQEPPYQPVPQYSQPQYAPPPPQYAAAPQYGQPQYVPAQGGPPSFLRGAMQTAAGVAAGALAFEGVESILHGFGHGGYGSGVMGMGMGPGLGGGFERPVEETVVNNYYEEPGTRGFEHERPEGERHFHETADQGGAQSSDASYNTAEDDRMAFDDSSVRDDSSGFDGGNDAGMGFDDGGSYGGDSGGDLA